MILIQSQVDDDLARECAAPGGAGVAGALSRIVRRHGRAGLWRGMVPVLITMGVSNFVYFYCFSGMKVHSAVTFGICMFCVGMCVFFMLNLLPPVDLQAHPVSVPTLPPPYREIQALCVHSHEGRWYTDCQVLCRHVVYGNEGRLLTFWILPVGVRRQP